MSELTDQVLKALNAEFMSFEMEVQLLRKTIKQLEANSPTCAACASMLWVGGTYPEVEHTCHKELREQLAMATDAANKGDLARQNAGAMEEQIKELQEQLAQEKKWKEEDPRMLREQMRVADEAFNRINDQNKALLEVAKAASHNPCRHTSDHTPYSCDTCAALATLKQHGIDL